MKKTLLTAAIIGLGWHAYLDAADDKKTEAQLHQEQQKALLNQFINDNKLAFDSYRAKFRNGLAQYKDRVKGVWGYAEVSTNSKWVHYSDDLTGKLVVDYQNNSIGLQVGALHSEVETLQFIESTLNQSTDNLTVAESLGIERKDIPIIAKQLLEDSNQTAELEFVRANVDDLLKTKALLQAQSTQLSLKEQRLERNYIAKIDREIEQAKSLIEQSLNRPNKPANSNDKKAQTRKVSAKIKVGDKRVNRAKLYQEFVHKQSTFYGLPKSLIYAVMEVESSFNPRAQSPVPAFGLMQIVPSTAGKDVNRYLNKGNKAPTPEELYQPPNNVLMGTTYLAMLNQTYFKDVKDPLSKSYCVIAAYNTGMGNVAALFSRDGTKNLFKAAQVINRMTPQQVHDKIKSRAHPETKRYITKVLNAQVYFEQAI